MPKITSLSANTGTVEGQYLQIKGLGFTNHKEDVRVKVGNIDCDVIRTSYDSIECRVK